jgi:hypothetical protein
MDLNRKTLTAVLLVLLGLGLVVTGVSLIYLPAGLVVAGVGVGAAGLLAVDVDSGDPS